MAKREREVGSNVLPFRRPGELRDRGCLKCSNVKIPIKEMTDLREDGLFWKCPFCGWTLIVVTDNRAWLKSHTL